MLASLKTCEGELAARAKLSLQLEDPQPTASRDDALANPGHANSGLR
jgi:hypothetical protein